MRMNRYAPFTKQIVEQLKIPKFNPILSNSEKLRFGRKGSLMVNISGKKAGLFYDFERSTGGTFLSRNFENHF